MKSKMRLVEIIIFSLYDVIVGPTKIIKGADKNKAQFLENNVLSKQYVNKSWTPNPISFRTMT